jgi:hypothetical protein
MGCVWREAENKDPDELIEKRQERGALIEDKKLIGSVNTGRGQRRFEHGDRIRGWNPLEAWR